MLLFTWFDPFFEATRPFSPQKQGNPLGSLLFCLVLHPFVSQHDHEVVEQEGAVLDLLLNEHKSEAIC